MAKNQTNQEHDLRVTALAKAVELRPTARSSSADKSEAELVVDAAEKFYAFLNGGGDQ